MGLRPESAFLLVKLSSSPGLASSRPVSLRATEERTEVPQVDPRERQDWPRVRVLSSSAMMIPS